ncbi:hypothetical protein D1007_36890 [Hordeum vulgare]|nr:hypothetical protein D1007_36890 [Hordeum vulgare]
MAEAEFVVAQPKEMAEQQVVMDSIRGEAKVEASRQLIRQRRAEVDALFDELDAKIEAEEAATEQSEGGGAAAGDHLQAGGHGYRRHLRRGVHRMHYLRRDQSVSADGV